ncbi:MAG: small basic protein [Candidatus Gygaella obscura]|nr:small basic protein [Candidatus Gygaella obscura]
MSIHPSLKYSLKNKKQTTVLRRIDRIKELMEKGLFKDEDIFKLPKTKLVKIKMKKSVKVEKTEAGDEKAAADVKSASTAKPAGKKV